MRAPYPAHWEAVQVYYLDATLMAFLRDVLEWRLFNRRITGVPCPELEVYISLGDGVAEAKLPAGIQDLKAVWSRIVKGARGSALRRAAMPGGCCVALTGLAAVQATRSASYRGVSCKLPAPSAHLRPPARISICSTMRSRCHDCWRLSGSSLGSRRFGGH